MKIKIEDGIFDALPVYFQLNLDPSYIVFQHHRVTDAWQENNIHRALNHVNCK